MNDRVKLDPSWKQALTGEFDADYMVALRQFLVAEKGRVEKSIRLARISSERSTRRRSIASRW